MKVLLGVTGSVAAKLTPQLYQALSKHEVRLVATEKSLFFWQPYAPSEETSIPVLRDSDEWRQYQTGMPVLHIELRNWADALLLAPLTANTLAKITNGFADNLLTSVVRAWDRSKPLIIAPAMNTQMWDSPITLEHLQKLRTLFPNLTVIYPVTKKLACGETGMGAMAPIDSIVETLDRSI